MKVSREWLKDFDQVMNHQRAKSRVECGDKEIAECKIEARQHEAWALVYYPWAASVIRGEA